MQRKNLQYLSKIELKIYAFFFHIKHFLVDLARVVRRMDSAIHWVNHYSLDNSLGFAINCLSAG